jgi:hypothetical protein
MATNQQQRRTRTIAALLAVVLTVTLIGGVVGLGGNTSTTTADSSTNARDAAYCAASGKLQDATDNLSNSLPADADSATIARAQDNFYNLEPTRKLLDEMEDNAPEAIASDVRQAVGYIRYQFTDQRTPDKPVSGPASGPTTTIDIQASSGRITAWENTHC